MKKTVYLTGPTASGKTGRAVALARVLGAEIISADSRQVYRGMDLGSGKDLEEYGSVPYHLIDVADAGEKYNLYRFLSDYRQAENDIVSRGRRAICCGGTGLYLESVIKGIKLPQVPENPKLRDELKACSLGQLTQMLASMKRLHNRSDTDTRARAIRAIEIEKYYLEHPAEALEAKPAPEADPIIIGVEISRDIRREKIRRRLLARLEAGMAGEVEGLLSGGVDPEVLIGYGLEYKYLTLYITGKMAYDDMVSELYTAICQFAKRQMTWFRGMERRGLHIDWLSAGLPEEEFTSRAIEIIRTKEEASSRAGIFHAPHKQRE